MMKVDVEQTVRAHVKWLRLLAQDMDNHVLKAGLIIEADVLDAALADEADGSHELAAEDPPPGQPARLA